MYYAYKYILKAKLSVIVRNALEFLWPIQIAQQLRELANLLKKTFIDFCGFHIMHYDPPLSPCNLMSALCPCNLSLMKQNKFKRENKKQMKQRNKIKQKEDDSWCESCSVAVETQI